MNYLLPQLVDRSADRRPDSAAIRCRGVELSYAQLAEQSNRVAHYLVEQGVRRGDRVGVLMNKCVECAVAIHGIMKAGAAYVPLDPTAPTVRQAFVVKDCGIRHVISEPGRRSAVAALAREVRLDSVLGCELDETRSAGFAALESFEHRHAPALTTMEQDLAYVLYTSGSTGVPKGIMHTHRSGLAWAEVTVDVYGITHRDRISNYAPLHFDLSTLDYFGAALAGAATVMVPEEVTKLPASLATMVAEERLTILYTVPLALTQLARSNSVGRVDMSALRWILFGGEQMPPKYLAVLMAQLPHVRFCNVYGPTETNGCTHFVIGPDFPEHTPIPIGAPYPNVEARVVDANDRDVTADEVGELVIRAPTLMRGYWNRDDLNARCSLYRDDLPGIPDRFHRTGDLVGKNDDGTFRFVGRKDRQIKARGCRVDLDEIETILLGFDSIAEAAVFPVPDEAGHLMIESAVIPADDGLSRTELRNALKSKLPPYALPVRIDIVDALPRTSTGKVDRVTLAEAAASRVTAEAS
ncbi:MAG: amino acid adenylation domain-containing protein [Gammaproteobacteria bacterium]|nr:amino acid adenylation domain-containing protein [Gammaproteobacteria bacterium]